MSIVMEAVSWSLLAVAVVCCAKTHGRQVRLRREAEGVMSVQFGRDNGPIVDAIWQRDRVAFWATFAVLGTLLAYLGGRGSLAEVAWFAVAGFALSFVVVGIAWAVALALASKPVGHVAWLGTLGWVVVSLASVAVAYASRAMDW